MSEKSRGWQLSAARGNDGYSFSSRGAVAGVCILCYNRGRPRKNWSIRGAAAGSVTGQDNTGGLLYSAFDLGVSSSSYTSLDSFGALPSPFRASCTIFQNQNSCAKGQGQRCVGNTARSCEYVAGGAASLIAEAKQALRRTHLEDADEDHQSDEHEGPDRRQHVHRLESQEGGQAAGQGANSSMGRGLEGGP